MTTGHRALVVLSASIMFAELSLALYFNRQVADWLSHNLWVVLIPFTKIVLKRLLALKLITLIKSLIFLFWHLSKLLILKLFKTLSVRYGVFFSQNRWYWIRKSKVMFLRRGKQFFRGLVRFWAVYNSFQKWIILIAFFPVIIVLFLLGLSFNVTRKTMVQKAQESAIFEVASSASNTNRGIRAWVARIDKATLQRIRDLTPRGTDK